MSYSMNDQVPAERPLKAYAFDPSQGKNFGNHMTIAVKNEAADDPPQRLLPGPIGKYIAVIDYDATNDVYYKPVDLNDPLVMMRGGLDPSESDPRFHQQMVYAVASETIRRFEFALGRKARWGFRGGKKEDPHFGKLRMFPHAMQEANAYYDRDLRAVVFGYFSASTDDPGTNLPGQTVFTCLSHDIIAHETTHALIDGQREFFYEASSPDTAAFHEGFADICALFQHFSYKDALIEMIQRTGGLIYRERVGPNVAPDGRAVIQEELSTANPLVALAQQFGEAMGRRAALRQALGTPPNSDALKKLFEPHERGAILVAAVFDAFFSVYVRRTHDLMTIAQSAGAVTTAGHLSAELANRLAGEAAKTAQHFSNICIRALDYCPPVDIMFGDFLRAMITADYHLVPIDKYGYRAALIEAFRSRGIYPEDVSSLAEEALLWCPPDVLKGIEEPVRCEGLKFNIPKPTTPQQQRANARTLHKFGKKNAFAIGLNQKQKIQPFSFHAVHRVAPDGQLKIEILAELMQQMAVDLEPDNPDAGWFVFRGGTTLVLKEDGTVRYAIQKNLGEDNSDNTRLGRQRAYYQEMGTSLAITTYGYDLIKKYLPRRGQKTPMNFALIHRGY